MGQAMDRMDLQQNKILPRIQDRLQQMMALLLVKQQQGPNLEIHLSIKGLRMQQQQHPQVNPVLRMKELPKTKAVTVQDLVHLLQVKGQLAQHLKDHLLTMQTRMAVIHLLQPLKVVAFKAVDARCQLLLQLQQIQCLRHCQLHQPR